MLMPDAQLRHPCSAANARGGAPPAPLAAYLLCLGLGFGGVSF
uniref:Uncharacterized protein n=1 Tax=Arundo donax TaxID=35708 RepID=A0A0A8YDQ3_ARUDO